MRTLSSSRTSRAGSTLPAGAIFPGVEMPHEMDLRHVTHAVEAEPHNEADPRRPEHS